jgi:hypothetical protein
LLDPLDVSQEQIYGITANGKDSQWVNFKNSNQKELKFRQITDVHGMRLVLQIGKSLMNLEEPILDKH